MGIEREEAVREPQSVSAPKTERAAATGPPGAQRMLDLQRTMGNQAVGALLAAAQPKLTVGAADDPHERQADALADERVELLRSDAPAAPPEKGGTRAHRTVLRRLHRRTDPTAEPSTIGWGGGDLDSRSEAQIGALRADGNPLPARLRRSMEGAFGADFGDVQLHRGTASETLNQKMGAAAFTVGNDIFLGAGTASLEHPAGQRLLAHELAHTLQQASAGVSRQVVRRDTVTQESSASPPTVDHLESLEAIDRLSPAQIDAIDVKTSPVPYNVIHDVFHQSWHVVKEELLAPSAEPGVTDVRRAFMRKLLEYRDWHHQEILKEVRTELDKKKGEGALLPSKGGGSETLTSDIDVNLKGAHTELAVAAFNAAFKKPKSLPSQTWDFEPGVVYDVNVYAIDFMHEFSPVEQEGHRVTKKEGARKGGIGGIGDAALAAADRKDQLATSLFKARLFMTQAQFDDYKATSVRGLAEPQKGTMLTAFTSAEVLFAGYLDEMATQMGGHVDADVDKAESGVKQLQQRAAALVPAKESADAHATGAKREDVLMSAANRIYERKLDLIHTRRAVLANLIRQLGKPEFGAPEDQAALEGAIDQTLLEIRRAVAEAAMYANEASMTDATIHHGVVGIQGGKEIEQQKHEGLDALNEHLADVHKEAARYGGFGEGAYKAGKYLMRLADAARNMGFGYIFGVQQLYDAGRQISVDIKGEADKRPVDTAEMSAAVVKRTTGAASLEALLGFARQVAGEVTQEYMQERAVETKAGGADTAAAYGHRTGKKGEANTNVLNKGMVHPADRGPGKKADGSEMEKAQKEGNLGDFRFRLEPEELAQLQEKWAKNKKS